MTGCLESFAIKREVCGIMGCFYKYLAIDQIFLLLTNVLNELSTIRLQNLKARLIDDFSEFLPEVSCHVLSGLNAN